MNRSKRRAPSNQTNRFWLPISKGEVIGAIAVLSFLIGTAIYPNRIRQRLIQTGQKTVADVTQAGFKNATVTFWANGRKCTKVVSTPHSSIQSGEKYELSYNQKDVTEATVLFEHPVFDRREYATTTATYIKTFWLNSLIEFRYVVGIRNYERYQKRLSDRPIDDTHPARVTYNIMDPSIAYLEY
jgi:hypothetical protein